MPRLKYLPYWPPVLPGVKALKTEMMEKAATTELESPKRPSDKLFCCLSLRQRIPETVRDELYHVIRMSGPLLLSRFLNYLLPCVVTIFCGRLGNDVMGAHGLAFAVINVTTVSTGLGLALACDTLVSQTFGAKNLLRVGIMIQRGTFILLLFTLPCWGLLINSESILLCLGQDPNVSRIAQLYITAHLPAIPAIFLHQLQSSYLQNQGIIMPQMYASALANVANLATNYVFINLLDLGVHGSAAAHSLSQIYNCLILYALIRWRKLHVATWGGWTVESLQEWGAYMKLAVPSMFMICFEWWVYEFGGFFAGMLSEDELAGQHGLAMIAYMIYMFPLGIQAAVSARVGNALGAGDTQRALLIAKLSLGLSFVLSCCESIFLGITKDFIGYIFTDDEKVAGLVSHLLNAYCFVLLFDGLVCVCIGIFTGLGKQKIPAVCNLIGYYGIGLTMALTLMFVVKLRVIGFWLGLLICVVITSTFYITVIFRLDWKKITEEAVERAQKKTQLAEMVPDFATSPESTMAGYLSVSTEDNEKKAAATPSTVRLSNTQLVLRRGFTLLVCLGLLASGVFVHVLVPLPEIVPIMANSTLDNSTSGPDLTIPTWTNSYAE